MAENDNSMEQTKEVQEAVSELLHANHIYAIGAYGWSSPDDVDPETVGHAMWQIDGPTDALLDTVMSPAGAEPPKVTKWQVLCSVAGADFEGLMIAARISIGLALYQVRVVGERLDAEDSLASVHVLSALMTLGVASDRLRDLLVAAVFQKTLKEYRDRVPGRGVGARGARALRRDWPDSQAATAGSLTMGSSLKGAMVSSVMYRPR